MASYSRYHYSSQTREARRGRLFSYVFYPLAGLGVAFALMSFLLGTAAGQATWDDNQRGALVYFMTTIATVALLVPALNNELDWTTRLFARCCCFFVIALAVSHGFGVFDPLVPLQAIVDHVILPLRHRYNI